MVGHLKGKWIVLIIKREYGTFGESKVSICIDGNDVHSRVPRVDRRWV